MPADHANIAAAQGAGYVIAEQADRGSGKVPRFVTKLEKWVTGDLGEDGHIVTFEGYDQASQANANATALAALNTWRKSRYGYDTTNVNKAHKGSGNHTVDVT